MIEASCLCEGCRWEAEGTMGPVVVCHCGLCRKDSGTSFSVAGGVPESGFRWVYGEDRVRRYESSPGFFRNSCLTCGTPLPGDPQDGRLFVPLGTVAGDPGARPQLHIFTASRAPWTEIDDDLAQFETLPPGFEAPEPGDPRPASEPGLVRGSCLCDGVAWELEEGFTRMRNCHCSRCRTARGGAYATNGLAPRERFRWLRGGDQLDAFPVPGARHFHHTFCRGCGASMPRVDPERGIVIVPAGSIDGDPGAGPTEHIWVGSKAPWFEITDGLPQHPEGPPPG
jgi:hypothetical protein